MNRRAIIMKLENLGRFKTATQKHAFKNCTRRMRIRNYMGKEGCGAVSSAVERSHSAPAGPRHFTVQTIRPGCVLPVVTGRRRQQQIRGCATGEGRGPGEGNGVYWATRQLYVQAEQGRQSRAAQWSGTGRELPKMQSAADLRNAPVDPV